MEKKCLIIDCGSGYCKVGYSGNSEPSLIIPTVIGEQNKMITEEETNKNESDKFFGQAALDKSSELKLTNFVQKTKILDFDYFEIFFDHIFKNELKINPEDYTIFITEPPLTSKKSREKISEIFFEKFNVSSLFITNGAVLSLYGACKYSGYVLDCGFDSSTITPINDGYPFSNCIKKLYVGGKNIYEYLNQLLTQKNSFITDNNKNKIINDIIQNYSYVSSDTKNENNITNYKLPDNSEIILDKEKYMPVEILFHPEIISEEVGGVANLVTRCAAEIDSMTEDEKFDLNNLVICGGGSLFKGFGERLGKEICNYYGGKYSNKFNIVDIKERRFLQWIGASIYSLMKIFNGLCTSKEDYKKNGVSAIHNKCFY